MSDTFIRDATKQNEYKARLEAESISIYGVKKCYASHKQYKGLIASHIKPYKLCVLENDTESMFNINNGLLLAKHIDDYFDKFLITFDNDGKIICSTDIPDEIKDEFESYRIDEVVFNDIRKRFMQIHRSLFYYKHYYGTSRLGYANLEIDRISIPFYDCGIKFYKDTFIIGFAEYVTLSSSGSAQPNLSTGQIGNYYFLVSDKQDLIVNFLDKKCAEIDRLIAHEEAMIDELKAYKQSVITEAVTKGLDRSVPMKDSCVEWIGEIPNHWATAKLKNVCKIFGRIGFRGYRQDDMVDEGEGAITLSPSNMRDAKMNYEKCSYLSWKKYFESPEIQIHNGDILFVKTGSTFGKVALVDNLLFEATVNPQIIVLKNFTILNKYLCYFLCTPIIRAQVDCTVVGGTIPTISQEKIYNYSALIPPTKEQQQIAEYLDRRCNEIDRLISLKQEKIEELRDYKKSLIYEYVTGKKEVCE